MRKISFKKAFMLAFALLAGYSVHQVQASAGLSDLEKRNVEALSSGYVFVDKSSCFDNVIRGADDGSTAVWVTWCQDCTSMWAIHASGSNTCSSRDNDN